MKLKFLIDECTGRKLSIFLNESGYDSIFSGDINPRLDPGIRFLHQHYTLYFVRNDQYLFRLRPKISRNLFPCTGRSDKHSIK